jgi:hydrogenase large subunit
MAVAHYLEALRWQREIAEIHAIFGGKNPHPNYLVGGVPCVIAMQAGTGINIERLNLVHSRITQAIRVVEELYIPDLLAIASFYPEWTKIGGGLRNYMAYGDLPRNGIDDPRQFRIPGGVVLNRDLSHVLPVDLTDTGQVREEVAHSWYEYPQGSGALHPWEGVTEPRYTGPKPPYQQLDESGKYSWLKAPRWKGLPMEVGPLARVLVGYASGGTEFKEVVGDALARLKVPVAALFSTLGRTAARAIETRLAARWLLAEYERLIANIKSGDTTTADSSSWDPNAWPAEAKGFGFTEAPRGALGHWIRIRKGKIDNYQIVVPSTWNASPKDGQGQHGAYEAALLDTPIADPQRPIEILRTIHSFDPCLACASHVLGPDGRKLAEVIVR